MHLHHYLPIAGLPDQRRMYDTIRRDYYKPNMAKDVYTTVTQFAGCVTNGNQDRHRRPLQLLPVSGLLYFVAIGIVGFLPKTAQASKYAFVLTDWYIKLTQAA